MLRDNESSSAIPHESSELLPKVKTPQCEDDLLLSLTIVEDGFPHCLDPHSSIVSMGLLILD